MERDQAEDEKVLSEHGGNKLKIRTGYDAKTVERIARNCDSKSVKDGVAFLRRINIFEPERFYCEVIDDVGFFAGLICKDHFRLYEIAVENEYKGKGYGKIMLLRVKKICWEHGLTRITLRTSKEENAVNFYRKFGGKITGQKKNDWEMELKV